MRTPHIFGVVIPFNTTLVKPRGDLTRIKRVVKVTGQSIMVELLLLTRMRLFNGLLRTR